MTLLGHPLQRTLDHLFPALLHTAHNHYKGKITGGDGTLYPWTYAGLPQTYFPLHTEDADLNSANLHIAGEPKVWLIIPKEEKEKLFEKFGGK